MRPSRRTVAAATSAEMTEGGAMRAIDCPCGHQFEAADDEDVA
jgi:hypothetical protein